MISQNTDDILRIFQTRLITLERILSLGERALPDRDAALLERLAPDMLPLGTQIAFACNQPRGFAQWCAGQPLSNLDPEVTTMAGARSCIEGTRALLTAIKCDDSRLEESKRTELGSGLYCETSVRLYVSDFLMPNFYFHLTITYAILRSLGVPLGKADYMSFLMPHVKRSA